MQVERSNEEEGEWCIGKRTNYLYPDSIPGNRRNRKMPRWCTAQLTNNKKILTKRSVMAGLFVVNKYRQLDNNYLFSLFGSFNGQQLSTNWQQVLFSLFGPFNGQQLSTIWQQLLFSSFGSFNGQQLSTIWQQLLFSLFGSSNGQQLSTIWQQVFVLIIRLF